jgi:tyrosinase
VTLTRKNYVKMTQSERDTFHRAMTALVANGTYYNLVELHQKAMATAHKNPWLLPWHRALLLWLEDELKNVNGGVPIAVPYWRWRDDSTAGNTATIFGPSYAGGFGTSTNGYRVTTGPCASWRCIVYNGTTNQFVTRSQPGILRHWAQGVSAIPRSTTVDAALTQATYDAAPWDRTSTTGFRAKIEAPHNNVHNVIGGDMLAGTSPMDMLFWLHHCEIDRIWELWMTRKGRLYAGPSGKGLDDAMFPSVPLSAGYRTPRQLIVATTQLGYNHDILN